MSAEQEEPPNDGKSSPELFNEAVGNVDTEEEINTNEENAEQNNELTNEQFAAAAAAAVPTNANFGNETSGTMNGQIENSEEEGSPPEGDTSGIKIGEGSPQERAEEEVEDDTTIVLGQSIKIKYQSSKEIIGRIYYISDSRIRIMPIGESARLVDFELIDGGFAPELNVLEVDFGEKIPQQTFVSWQGFRVDQILDAYTKDGEPVGTYKVISINEKEDKATLENTENNDVQECDFASEGIPLDKPFDVLRIQPSITSEPTAEQVAEIEKQRQLASIPGALEAAERGEDVSTESLEFFEIEEAPQAIIETIEKSKQIYPEIAQKSSLVADLSTFYDQTSLRNPNVLKKIRVFAELVSNLKNSTIQRNPDGSILGEAKLSAETMLDVVSDRVVPIVRPVLETKRVLVSDYPEQVDKESNGGLLSQRRFDTLIEKSVECIEKLAGIPPSEPGVGLPRWYQMLNQYFTMYPTGDEFSSAGYTFPSDNDFFRHAAPGLDKVPGLMQSMPDKQTGNQGHGEHPLDNYILDDIFISTRRAHGPTLRALPKGGTELARLGDRAEVKGYVLFPYKVIHDGALGASRTGTLWEDLLRSGTERTLMKVLIEKYGGIVEEDLDAQKINYLDITMPTAVRIEFNEYLKLLLKSLAPTGLGSTGALKADLGIEEYEFTSTQQEIVDARVKEVIASVRNYIRQLREQPISTDSVARPLQENLFLQMFETKLAQHPELVRIVKAMQKELPGYKNIDIAVFAYTFVHAQDYVLAVLGGNMQNVQREQLRFIRDLLLQKMQDASRVRARLRNAGQQPKPNPCAHTKDLLLVRKASTDNERIILLSRFLNLYRAGREDNWITCKICKQHLICHHEVLQIQQYLNPREKAGLQKEIILNFSGGTFGRHHICRNCGLPIAELDFDTGLEYDDEGRPMSGRAVIVDKDEIVKEQVEILLGTKILEPEEIKFNTEKKNQYYTIAKNICDYMGFPIGLDGLTKLVEKAESYEITKVMSPEKYKEFSTKTEQKLAPYKNYVAYIRISLVLALLFIEIQTATPEYRILSTIPGCKPSFGGFPLAIIQGEPTPENSPGISYLACAMAKMPARSDAPWIDGFGTIKQIEARQSKYFKEIVSRMKILFATDIQLEKKLAEKRKYLEQVLGYSADGHQGEKLPNGFLPRMERATEAAENAAASPAIVEGAKKTEEGEAQQADTWLRTANSFARSSAIVLRGSPYAESSCCYSKITQPNEFWIEKGLPPLPAARKPDLYFRRRTILFPVYETRPLQEQVFKLSSEDYYKVFLEICWQGPRVGLAHEFGYDYKCDWCGLEIPVEYIYPNVFEENPDWSKKKRQEKREEAIQYEKTQIANLKAKLQGEGVPFEDETAFRNLIATANSRRMFREYVPPKIVQFEVVDKLLTLDIPPTQKFTETLHESIENLKTLSVDSSESDILAALKPLMEPVTENAKILQEVLSIPQVKFLRTLMNNPTFESLEILRSYFLIPALRILEDGFEVEERTQLPSIYIKGKTKTKFHDEHIKLITDRLQFHVKYVTLFKEHIQTNELAMLKLQNFIEELDCFLRLSDELKVSRMQFDDKPISSIHELLLKAILQTVLFGTVSTLLDATHIPETDSIPTDDPSETVKLLGSFIDSILIQFDSEKISYNPEFVKQTLAKEKEIELQGVISRFNKMTDEQRDVEQLKQNLKLGRFDIGTKAFKYDADFWELQRQERMANHQGLELGADGEFIAGQVDAFGNPIDGGNEGEGYDMFDDDGEQG